MPITPEQGMAFMRQMQQLQRPGGGGIGAAAAGSPTQGLIARLMSDNPGGVLGALMKQRDPNQPGSMASVGAGPLPAMPPGGMPPMMPGAPANGAGAAPGAGGGGFMDMLKGGGDGGGIGMLSKLFGGMGGAGGGAGSW